MGKKANRAHTRLMRDTTDTKVWFKLYKSGTKWLIAGVAATTFGLAGTAISAKADTSDPAVTSTVTAPADSATAASTATEASTMTSVADSSAPVTDVEAPATSTTEAASTTPAVSAPEVTTPTTQTPATATTESSTQSTAVTEATPADNTQTPPATQVPATQSAEAVPAPATDTPSNATTAQSVAETAPTPEVTPTEAPAPAGSSEASAAATTQPADVVVPLALAAKSSSVSAVNPDSVDITELAYGTPEYGTVVTKVDEIVTPLGGGIFYSDGEQVFRIAPNAPAAIAPNDVITEVFTNKSYIQGVTFSATNTRTVDGQITLTDQSTVTMHVPGQTITVNGNYFMKSGIGGPWFVWSADQGSANEWGLVQKIDLITGRDETNDAEEVKSAQVSLANSTNTIMIPEKDYTANFDYGNFWMRVRGYYMVVPGTDGRMQVTGSEGQFIATTIDLTPTVDAVDPNSTVVTGTGTAPGNTITITNDDKTVTATVDDDGNWDADLTGFDPSTDIFLVESNDLGDTPGIVALPQVVNAQRHITYVNDQGDLVAEVVAQTLPITRDVTVTDATTPDPTYGEWTPVTADGQFDEVVTPVLDGYFATLPVVDAAGIEIVDLNNPTTPIAVTVEYQKLGAWTTNDPSVGDIDYENDPNDASAIKTDTVIPYVANKTPTSEGKPLTQVDPNDVTKGYLPPTPTTLNIDTPIDYRINPQLVILHFRDVTDASDPKKLVDHYMTGAPGELVGTGFADEARIAQEKLGYIYVASDIPDDVEVDSDDAVDQEFTMDFIRRTETITPDKPGVPGTAVDPDDPDGVKWPAGSDDVTNLSKVVTETITYVGPNGDNVSPTHTDQVSFTRTATVDLVTGKITPSTTWTAANDDTTFDAVTSPVIATYYTATPVVDAVTNLTADSQDATVEVIYQKLAAWTPTNPAYPEIAYPNDPNNAGSVLDPADPAAPVIPYVPGVIPQGPDGQNLTPKDPNDPSQGYIPPTPTDPGQSTPITYVDNIQKGTVTYQDINDAANPTPIGNVDELTGEGGTTSDYRTTERIAALVAQGYVLVADGYPSNGVVFDNNLDQDQAFIVTFTHGTATITPTMPGKPGDPVDPDNPDGAKWPEKSDDVTALTKVVTETITYVATDNPEIAPTHTDQVTFTRDGIVDLVTGDVTPSETWTATGDDTTFDAVDSPVIATYYTVTPTVDAVTGLTADSPDKVVQVDYQKLAGWVPTDPSYPEVPYPNDPKNPGGVLSPTDPDAPVIPYVPGVVPQGPDGQNLTPKDPNDPSQGYIPPTPADPGQATPITYVDNIQKGTVTYQDINDAANPTPIGNVDELTGEGGTTSDYRTTERIAALIAQGYVLVNDEYPTDGVKFDNDLSQNQAFIVTFTHGTAPVTPETPGKPGDPVDPEKPAGPKWPVGSDDVTALTKTVTETVTYVDVTGNTVAPTHTDQVSFTSDGVVDLVTGVVTPNGTWTAVDGDTTFDAVVSPTLTGYFADQVTVPAVTDLTADSTDVTVEVTYKQLGSWTSTEPGGEPIPYPNDPTKPDGILDVTDPAAPVIPYVPGKTPQGPDGTPLTPKDPTDPTQGYLPPIPGDLSEDTPITYVPDTVTGPDTGGTTPGGTTPGGTTPGTGTPGTTPGTGTPGTTGPEATTPGPVTETPSNDPTQLGPTAPEAPQSGTGIGTGTTPARGTNTQQPTQASPVAVSSPVANPQAPTAGAAQPATGTQSAQQLPQTDDAVSIWRQVGLALLSLLGLVGLTKRRRHDGGDA